MTDHTDWLVLVQQYYGTHGHDTVQLCSVNIEHRSPGSIHGEALQYKYKGYNISVHEFIALTTYVSYVKLQLNQAKIQSFISETKFNCEHNKPNINYYEKQVWKLKQSVNDKLNRTCYTVMQINLSC